MILRIIYLAFFAANLAQGTQERQFQHGLIPCASNALFKSHGLPETC
jgi:hypothetical protein